VLYLYVLIKTYHFFCSRGPGNKPGKIFYF